MKIDAFSGNPSQKLRPVELNAPDKTRGLALMKALDLRNSDGGWSSEKLSLQDLSDLLWAAHGVNRPGEGKRTAASALNAQDIDVYVLMEEGAYLYDAFKQLLAPVASGDYRSLAATGNPPVVLVMVSDVSRFPMGGRNMKLQWAEIDCGIVSQGISVFCAAAGLATRPRTSFSGKDELAKVLDLSSSQHILLNHPVGYSEG